MKAVVIDIGGVLVDLDRSARDETVISYQKSSHNSLVVYNDVPQQWQHDLSTGRLTLATYLQRMSNALRVPKDVIEAAERAMIASPNAELLDCLRLYRRRLEIFVFSNTQPLHWAAAQQIIGIEFSGSFLSHEIGCRKPQKSAFAHVAQAMRVGQEILFVDDELENVTAANSQGWSTHHHSHNAHTIAWLEQRLGPP